MSDRLLTKGYEVYEIVQLPPRLHHELKVNSHARPHFVRTCIVINALAQDPAPFFSKID